MQSIASEIYEISSLKIRSLFSKMSSLLMKRRLPYVNTIYCVQGKSSGAVVENAKTSFHGNCFLVSKPGAGVQPLARPELLTL